jgi:ribosomal-protein-serine acetyltransferase
MAAPAISFRPMFPWHLDDQTLLRPLQPADAPQFHGLIQANRAPLDRWLRWSCSIQTLENAADLIESFVLKQASGDGFHLGIWHAGRLAGGLVCWYIHRQNRNAELGYWLGAEVVGRGLATRSAALGLRHLFEAENLNRVEMLCGTENRPSRRVAERLGFSLEGIRRESHWITDRFVDHAVYGLLRSEWQPNSTTPPSH